MRCPRKPRLVRKHLDSPDGHLLEVNFAPSEKEMSLAQLKSADAQSLVRKYKPGGSPTSTSHSSPLM